jgi:hypothetical protein
MDLHSLRLVMSKTFSANSWASQSFVRSSARLKESRCAEARKSRTACQRSLRVTERDPNKPEQTVTTIDLGFSNAHDRGASH